MEASVKPKGKSRVKYDGQWKSIEIEESDNLWNWM